MIAVSFYDKFTDATYGSFDLPLETALLIDLVKTMHEADAEVTELSLPLVTFHEGMEGVMASVYLTTCLPFNDQLEHKQKCDLSEDDQVYEELSAFRPVKRLFFQSILDVKVLGFPTRCLVSLIELANYLGLQTLAFEAAIVFEGLWKGIQTAQLAKELTLEVDNEKLKEADKKSSEMSDVMFCIDGTCNRLMFLCLKKA